MNVNTKRATTGTQHGVNLVALVDWQFIKLHKRQPGERDIPVPAKARPGSHRGGWAGTHLSHVGQAVTHLSMSSIAPATRFVCVIRVSVCPVCPLCSEITHRHTFIYWYCTCTVSVIISPSSSNCRKSIHKQQTTLRQPIECAPSDGSKTMPTPLVQPCQYLRRAVPSRSLAPEGSGRGTTRDAI